MITETSNAKGNEIDVNKAKARARSSSSSHKRPSRRKSDSKLDNSIFSAASGHSPTTTSPAGHVKRRSVSRNRPITTGTGDLARIVRRQESRNNLRASVQRTRSTSVDKIDTSSLHNNSKKKNRRSRSRNSLRRDSSQARRSQSKSVERDSPSSLKKEILESRKLRTKVCSDSAEKNEELQQQAGGRRPRSRGVSRSKSMEGLSPTGAPSARRSLRAKSVERNELTMDSPGRRVRSKSTDHCAPEKSENRRRRRSKCLDQKDLMDIEHNGSFANNNTRRQKESNPIVSKNSSNAVKSSQENTEHLSPPPSRDSKRGSFSRPLERVSRSRSGEASDNNKNSGDAADNSALLKTPIKTPIKTPVKTPTSRRSLSYDRSLSSRDLVDQVLSVTQSKRKSGGELGLNYLQSTAYRMSLSLDDDDDDYTDTDNDSSFNYESLRNRSLQRSSSQSNLYSDASESETDYSASESSWTADFMSFDDPLEINNSESCKQEELLNKTLDDELSPNSLRAGKTPRKLLLARATSRRDLNHHQQQTPWQNRIST